MKCAFVFPGQGSQTVGMGREIYDAFPEARDVFQEVDEALGQNLTRLIFEGPQETLTLTENAQPALMAVSIALLRVLEKAKFDLKTYVQYLAGHSLGEYSALCAAQTFSLKETAKLLRLRGQAMQEAVPLGEGSMAALLGLELETVEDLLKNISLKDEVCIIANDNSMGQVVISGHTKAIESALTEATNRGAKRCVLLPVSAPFHSPLMEKAALKMKEALAHVSGKDPIIPVFSNVTAEPISDFKKIRELLYEQITHRVRWRETILNMATLGTHTLIEVGAGKVLTGLTKRIDPDITTYALNTPQDIEIFLKTL
ncbi:MAG: ACP S-malonyltransferase [Proteobacteria bacterium]|nr:ACP S-malonyltransferase [Pseudomonadota bacterium]